MAGLCLPFVIRFRLKPPNCESKGAFIFADFYDWMIPLIFVGLSEKNTIFLSYFPTFGLSDFLPQKSKAKHPLRQKPQTNRH